jgi:hypothetical protein
MSLEGNQTPPSATQCHQTNLSCIGQTRSKSLKAISDVTMALLL